jgi:type II pantothenate kinase
MQRLYESTIDIAALLPAGSAGIDAGLTLTKIVQATAAGTIEAFAFETSEGGAELPADEAPLGVTGARTEAYVEIDHAVSVQEIEAAARGARALASRDGDFVLALLGTGTAFAAVRGDNVSHLGGTALGGGSFAGIARRIAPDMAYDAVIAAAARGDRTRADMMVSDAYPHGIGRIGGAMTAAHLSKHGDASRDDVLAALLNLHGENIAQIAASRAIIAQIPHLVLVGGFAHENHALVESLTAMAQLFGVKTEVAPHAGFAGALGAAIMAAGPATGESSG